MRTLTRPELTAALVARQMLLERQRLAPAEAIRRIVLDRLPSADGVDISAATPISAFQGRNHGD